jgi:hypothetical protein
MQLARFQPTLGFLVALGLAGTGSGCGQGSQQLSPEQAKALEKAIAADNQNFYKDSRVKKSGGMSPGSTRGKAPGAAKSGP